MDDFATSLLVPDWPARSWLNSVPKSEPISPHNLRTWGVVQCGVSPEVVANALVRLESNTGFLKTAEALRVADKKRIFVVYHSSYGEEMQLPNMHSFIVDEMFINSISGVSGTHRINMCSLGSSKYENLKVAWLETNVPTVRGRKEFRSTLKLSGRAYWISIRQDRTCYVPAAAQEVQRGLFD
ncbi:MAG: hypothetical protein EXR07_02265 [Acetobacteraceae bacterium]|nr:hypothetical protein [Acetobacteraceae bacterium]